MRGSRPAGAPLSPACRAGGPPGPAAWPPRDPISAAGGRTIIDRMSMGVAAGPSSIILGANGAGKSVLMRLMHGLLAPTAGAVAWNEPDAERRRRLQAMVFQRPVRLRRSAPANILYALKVARIARM